MTDKRCINCCLSQTNEGTLYCYEHKKYVKADDICNDFEEYKDDLSNLGEYLKYKGEQL